MTEDKKAEESKGEELINGDVFMAMQTLPKLLEFEFHVTDSIKLRKLKQQLVEPYGIIEDIRNGLVRKYGEENPKGSGQLTVIGFNDPKGRPMSKNFPKYMEGFGELMNTGVKVKFEKIKLPSVVDDKPIPLSANDLDRIEKFVEVV